MKNITKDRNNYNIMHRCYNEITVECTRGQEDAEHIYVLTKIESTRFDEDIIILKIRYFYTIYYRWHFFICDVVFLPLLIKIL